MRRLEVRVLDPRIREQLPRYATAGAAGLDLRACLDAPLTLQPGDSQLVRSGLDSGLLVRRAFLTLAVELRVDLRLQRPRRGALRLEGEHSLRALAGGCQSSCLKPRRALPEKLFDPRPLPPGIRLGESG